MNGLRGIARHLCQQVTHTRRTANWSHTLEGRAAKKSIECGSDTAKRKATFLPHTD
ncbi:hypothetical protein QO004_004139 [Rhizobium mesoamericanum]|nr:hypothetical protein [Rhizobium mesoamericanum]